MQSTVRDTYRAACALHAPQTLLARLRARVPEALRARDIEVPVDAHILYDDVAGEVVIIHARHVWDGEAATVANEVARSVFSEAAQENSAPAAQWNTTLVRTNSTLARGTRWLFWGLNGLVLLYWIVWFIQFLFSDNYRGWFMSARDAADFGIIGVVLFLTLPAIPLAAVVHAALARQKAASVHYMRSLVAFEVPVLALAVFVNVAYAEMPLTPGLRILFSLLFLVLAVVWFFETHNITPKRPKILFAYYSAGTLALVSIVYILFVTFVPAYLLGAEEVLRDLLSDIGYIVLALLASPMTALLALGALLLWLVPLWLCYLFVRHIARSFNALHERAAAVHKMTARTTLVVTPLLFLMLLYTLSTPPEMDTYVGDLVLVAQADDEYAAQAARAQSLIAHKDALDHALEYVLNGRDLYLIERSDLSPDDYWSRQRPISSWYIGVVAFPFIFDDEKIPVTYQDRAVYNRGYERLFGVQYGYDPDRTVEQRTLVDLTSRDILAQTHDSTHLVEVTITDSLQTNASGDQEVVYEFSLPEHAVVTDLRLGPNLEHQGQIAPRGAAQQVYTQEVQRRIDPALLEQTGPRQYRLRVYPVPGVSDIADRTRREEVNGPTQRVQFTYVVLRATEGIPLPQYTATHNIDVGTVVPTVSIGGNTASVAPNGKLITQSTPAEALCTGQTVQTTTVGAGEAQIHFGAFGGSAEGYPACSGGDNESAVTLQGKRIHLLIDTSYGARHSGYGTLVTQLEELPAAFFEQNMVTYQLFNTNQSAVRVLHTQNDVRTLRTITYFGKADIAAALRALPISSSTRYDVVFIVTNNDRSFDSFEPTTTTRSAQSSTQGGYGHLVDSDLVYLHLDKPVPAFPTTLRQPNAEADSLNVASTVTEALTSVHSAQDGTLYRGAYWALSNITSHAGDVSATTSTSTTKTPKPALTWEQETLRMIASRALLDESARTELGTAPSGTSNNILQSLYREAEQLGIVTALSSYIALVNERQQSALDTASLRENRFYADNPAPVTRGAQFVSPLSPGVGGGFDMGATGVSQGAAFNVAPMDVGGGGGENTDLSFYSKSGGVVDGSTIKIAGAGGLVVRILLLVLVIALFMLPIYLVRRHNRHHPQGNK